MQAITEYINLIKRLKTQSNESSLKIYETLSNIKMGLLWKSPSFYKAQADFDYNEFSKMDFETFIRTVFGITRMWFESIEKILSLNNGRELLLKYGRSNMVTYYNSADDEKSAILNEVEKKQRLTPFSHVKRELYPNIRKSASVTDVWEKKYNDLKKKYEAMKKEYGTLKHEFDNYKKKVEALMNGIKKAA